MLKPFDSPCWRLTNPDHSDYDTGEGVQHFDSEAQARAYVTEYLFTDEPSAKQWERPCVLAFCDGCGAEFDDGVWAHTHFADGKTAHEMVGLYDDYRVEGGPADRKVFCPNCPAELGDEGD